MITEHIEIPTDDGVCDAFRVRPNKNNLPGVLLYMDAFGPRRSLWQMAEHLASHDYDVLVPNLLYRVKKAPLTTLDFPLAAGEMKGAIEQIMPLIQSLKPDEMMRDVPHFTKHLNQPLGIVGYCMGGSIALRAAAHYPDLFKAVACFHAGRLVTPHADSVHLQLHKIKAEIYVGHADHDSSMTYEQIREFEIALKALPIRAQAELYANAHHGFTQKDLPAYNQAAAHQHWQHLLDLFERTLQRD